MAEMEVSEILGILPHRYPMLLVDRIIECDSKERIVGVKNLTMNEVFFQGHFPNEPIMPGVLQLEAMAQVAGILINKMMGKEGQIAYFIGINNARFRRIVLPGDQLRIEVVLKKVRLGTAKIEGKTYVDGDIASEAEMTFRFKDS
jgi:beta-hydroxyacyl-ACP dehydratase FabZ